MQYRSLSFLVVSALLVLGLPLAAQATVLQSQNFEMDSVSFGSNITLVATLDSSIPNISSDGPTVTELQPTQVTISWKTDKISSSRVNYGTSSAYGQQNGASDLVTDHVITLYGLTPATVYHFQVVSTEAQGGIGQSGDKTFTTPAQNGVQSIRISDVTYTTALVSWQTGNVTNSTLDYGPSTAYGQSRRDASGSLTTNHAVQLTGLNSGTDYHVRITAVDGQGLSIVSSDFGFTTLANPAFVSIKVVDDSPNQVTLNWNTNVPTSGVITVNLKGQTTGGQNLGDGSIIQNHQTVVQTLIGDQKYVAVIVATDGQGHQVTSGPQEFATPQDTTPPQIQGLAVDVNSSNSSSLIMTASWKTDELATTEGVLEVKGSTAAPVTLPKQSAPTLDHVLIKSALDPATPYTLTVISTDPAGNVSKQTISFITPSVHKSILQLLLDSLTNAFGWAGKVFK